LEYEEHDDEEREQDRDDAELTTSLMYYCKIIHHLQLIRTKLTTRGRLVGLDTVPDTRVPSLQGDHSPDNVTFPDNSMTFP